MKKQLVSLVILLFSISLHASAQLKYQETMGDTASDYGSSIQQTTDGGYIITSPTYSFNGGDVYLIKTNANGTIFLAKHFGGADGDGSSCVRQTYDGGYVLAGYSESFGSGADDVYIIKTDANEILTWSKTVGGTEDEYGRSVRQTSDSGYIVTGNTESFGAGGTDVYLIKTDAAGGLLWTKTFGGTNEDEGYAAEQTNDGGFIITGYTTSFGAGGRDAYLIKTDDSGNALWTATFGGTGDDETHSVQQCTDGGYILTGFTNSFGSGNDDVYLIRTDSNGNLLWSKTFGGTDDDQGAFVQQTNDAGYIIAGQTISFGSGDLDAYLINTDSSGNVNWSKTYGGTGLEVGLCLDQTDDGGYAIVGIAFTSITVHADIYLVKADSTGSSGCNETDPPTVTITPATNVSNPPVNDFPGGSILTPSTVWGYGGTVITYCSPVGINEIQSKEIDISVYPNPSAGNFFIEFSGKIQNGSIQIFNAFGENIFDGNIFDASEQEINLTNISAGIYFVKVYDGERQYFKTLVIQ